MSRMILIETLNDASKIVKVSEVLEKYKPRVSVLRLEFPRYFNEALIKEIRNPEEYDSMLVNFDGAKELHYLLNHFKRIKWIQVLGTGINAFSHIKEIQERNIAVTNLKSISKEMLAEFAVTGALYFYKLIPQYLNLHMRKEWKSGGIFDVLELEARVVMIIGCGSIGREVAKKFKAFNTRIIGVKRDIAKIDPHSKQYIDQFIGVSDIRARLKEVDVLVVCLPYIGFELIDKSFFDTVKKDMVFINIGRGDCVNEEGLLNALREKRIRGAALDVLRQEPLPKDSPFYDEQIKDRLLITCHSIDRSNFLIKRTGIIFEHNLNQYLNNQTFDNIVDIEKGY